MEFERMEKLAALKYKIDTATEKLKVEIKCGLMDTAQAIEEIKARLQQIDEENKQQ